MCKMCKELKINKLYTHTINNFLRNRTHEFCIINRNTIKKLIGCKNAGKNLSKIQNKNATVW